MNTEYAQPFETPGTDPAAEYQWFLTQSDLPATTGLCAKVVRCLTSQLSEGGFTLELVAAELGTSPRTLQRNLGALNTSFMALRDAVRFHHAVRMLAEHNMSPERVASLLAFNRCGFASAFKRWTGMTPALFRRLYRDYA